MKRGQPENPGRDLRPVLQHLQGRSAHVREVLHIVLKHSIRVSALQFSMCTVPRRFR